MSIELDKQVQIEQEERMCIEARTKIENEIAEKKKKEENALMGKGCLILIAVAVLLTVMLTAGGNNDNKPISSPSDLQSMANIISQDYVKAALKSPSTAKFAPFKSREVIVTPNYEYLVTSYVDSQNSFGATIRSNYSAKLKFIGKTSDDEGDIASWQLMFLVVDGKKVFEVDK